MRAWIVPKGCTTLDQLRLVERTSPVPGAREVVVRVRATSLNYRDHAVVAGQYFGGATPLKPGHRTMSIDGGLVAPPLSDEVMADGSTACDSGFRRT